MIEFRDVNKWYGAYCALADINAVVQRGEVVVVCGPSGSGKSTLIRTVNRLEEIRSGEVLFEGSPDEILANPEVRRVYLGDRFN